MTVSLPTAPRAFHVMTKPIGPICNLDCRYCFYLEKEKLYPDKSNWRMPDNVLERYIQQYIEGQEVPEISFAWQGGEPTLMGLDFFRRIVEYQQKYASGRTIANAMQTNGTLLDDQWCQFLAENKFLVGLSMDGPQRIHDRYRVDKKGRPSFEQVMAGLRLMKKHGTDFNILCVINRLNSTHPLDVYRFFREEGSGFMQFIPLVERAGAPGSGLDLAEPPLLPILGQAAGDEPASPVTPWSVEPLAFGEFLCAIFDEWIRRDVGRQFVQIFDVMLGIWVGMPASLCVFAETCGSAMALEHNGDLYSCDHYVYPRYRLGNIMYSSIAEMAESPLQKKFGRDKFDTLPKYCRECDVRFACNGECPKHRFLKTPEGEPGLNYLCAGYKKFLHHIDPGMRAMAGLLRSGRPAADVMDMVAQREARERQVTASKSAGRNHPCPCGSGRKYKKCCWDKREVGV
jgi:uncharacterized protein